MDFEVLAEGLVFPEGPVAMEDGSVILVEIERGTLTRVWNGKTEVIAHLGGGPNGAAIGPDGAVYVCNSGGVAPPVQIPSGCPLASRLPADYECGRIERVDLATGKFERVYDTVDGHKLRGPNDIVFDAHGGFYFTDLGKILERTRDISGVYYGRADGSEIVEVTYGGTSFNGVGLSPDQKTLYAAETLTGRLIAWPIVAPGKAQADRLQGQILFATRENYYFDSMAVQANGDVCVATLMKGGVTTISPDGERHHHTPFPDDYVTNICFGGPDGRDAYITLSATGRLVKARWPEAGLKLNYNG